MTSITTNKIIALTVKPGLLVSMLSLALTGCEAPLNLEGVEQEKVKSVRRTDQFQAVASNGHTLVAVGNDGLILTSPTDTLNWQRQTLASSASLIDIAACPDQRFIALSVDKKVWQSRDNGQNWQASELPTPEDTLDLTCAPDNSLWVVGSFSTLLHSRDLGKTWQEHSLGEDAMLTGIQFLDQQTAIITGEFGLYVRSDDGGASWNPPEYIPNDFYTQSAYFPSSERGWVAGLSGQIMYTEDGGLSWTQQPTPTESPLYGFYKAGERLFAFGDHATVLEHSGGSWKQLPNPQPPVYIRDAMQLDNGQLLMAGGFGSLYALDIASGDHAQLSQK